MARLVHGKVVGAGGEEGCGRVEAAVVEEGVQGDGEEVGEGGEGGGCLGYWEGGTCWRFSHFVSLMNFEAILPIKSMITSKR